MPAKKPQPKDLLDIEPDAPVRQSPHILLYVILLIIAEVVLAGSTYLAWQKPVMGWEQRVFEYLNNLPDGLRLSMLAITMIGSTWMAAASVVVTALAKMYWLSWRLAVSIIAGYGAVFILKEWLLERPRPEGLYPDVHLRVGETLAGFPSGHSMLITVITLTMLPFLPKIWRWIIAGSLIALIGFSRIYLGVHAPLDVVAGIAIGVIVVCGIRILPGKIRHFFRLG